MKHIVTPWRLTVAAWKHVVRNVWLSLATVLVLTLALLSVNVLVGVQTLLTRAVNVLEQKVDVSIYFKAGTPEDIVDQARFFVVSLPQTASADVITADQALANFKAAHANDPDVLAALSDLDGNPLGATLVVKAKDTSDYGFLLNALQNPEFGGDIQSKDVDDHADAIARVREIADTVRTFGLGLILVFAAFAVLIVYNTIRVAIYTQREEIGVMRLVGASGAYVRVPFVLEGIFLGLVSLVLACGITYAAFAFVDPKLAPYFGGMSPGLAPSFIGQLPVLLATEGLGLLLLVALSSWAAVGKYLKK